MKMTYKQIKKSAEVKMQKFRDKEAGIDRKKLAMDKAVEAIEQKKNTVEVETIDNDDYYHTHTLGARVSIGENLIQLSTEETKALIMKLIDTLN